MKIAKDILTKKEIPTSPFDTAPQIFIKKKEETKKEEKKFTCALVHVA